MDSRPLGSSDLRVSSLAFGCWAIAGGFNWGEQDYDTSRATLKAAYEAGFTFFDTAEAYGNGKSEELIAEALGPVRSELVIATKTTPDNFAPADLRAACERSLRRLRTDWIDLYQLHWPNPDRPIDETLETLDRLKDEGKIRHYGVSNFGIQDLTNALETPYPIVSNQLSYSLLFRAVEYNVLPLCRQANVSVLCYSPLLQGLLTGKFESADEVPDDRARTRHFSSGRSQARHDEPGFEAETFEAIRQLRAVALELDAPMADVSIAWLLARPGVTSVIVGGRRPDQVVRNRKAADLVLPDAIRQRLDEATAPLKEKLGPNLDMWQGGERSRTR